MYNWIKGNVFCMQATINEAAITLNSAAAGTLKDCRYVRLGMDPEQWLMAVQPVSKRQIETGEIPAGQIQKLSVGKGYARISNKEAVREISRLIGRHPDGEKFPAEWNDADGILGLDLKKKEESV
mgnify:CR=1 FL=1